MHVRFFHALYSLSEAVSLSIEGGTRSKPLVFGELSEYLLSGSGFLQVTVTGSRTRKVYLQKTMPFFAPGAFTLAVIPGTMGMDILQTPDYDCFSSLPDFGCIRTVNLTDDPFSYYLYLYGKRLLFADVNFRHITCHKQMKEGMQGVYLTLPGRETPLIPSVFPIHAGQATTCYVYGSLSGDTLSLLSIEDTPRTFQLPG